MKRSIAILLGLTLAAGAGLAQAGRSGGGFHGGGGRGVAMSARPAPSGGFTRFTTGNSGGFTRFTTGPHPIGRPPGFIGRPFPMPPRPIQPIHSHPVIVGGGVIVTAPIFFPPPPYPYYPYPYPYVAPVAGGPAYDEPPTYSDAQPYSDQPYSDAQPNSETPGYTERNDYWYYCPDSQAYYPYVKTCPSPWVPVLPQPDGTAN